MDTMGFRIVGVEAEVVAVAHSPGRGDGRLRVAAEGDQHEARMRECTVRLAECMGDTVRGTVVLPDGAAHHDLAAAAAASGPWARPGRYAFAGELAFDGTVLPVRGALPFALAAGRAGLDGVVVPAQNAQEAAAAGCVPVLPVGRVGQLLRWLAGLEELEPAVAVAPGQAREDSLDLADVRGQAAAKRALEVAAAGRHSILLVGPPGTGKTMLARRLPWLLPPATREEALELGAVLSVRGLWQPGEPLRAARPFRAPHHTVSTAALVGGGIGAPRPGEVSLAHGGVLFLDELPEFRPDTLHALRRVASDGAAVVGWRGRSVRMPAGFLLAASANPCPCGYAGDARGLCTCGPARVEAYRRRIAPVADCFDLVVEVPQQSHAELRATPAGERTEEVRHRVEDAVARVVASGGRAESKVALCMLADSIARVARTVAALAGSAEVLPEHVREAEQLAGASSPWRAL